MHYIDILAMCCRVLSPSILFWKFQLCDIRIVDLTRRCKPLVFAFYTAHCQNESDLQVGYTAVTRGAGHNAQRKVATDPKWYHVC